MKRLAALIIAVLCSSETVAGPTLQCGEVDAEPLHVSATTEVSRLKVVRWSWQADCFKFAQGAQATGMGVMKPNTLSAPNVGNPRFWRCSAEYRTGPAPCRARCCIIAE